MLIMHIYKTGACEIACVCLCLDFLLFCCNIVVHNDPINMLLLKSSIGTDFNLKDKTGVVY